MSKKTLQRFNLNFLSYYLVNLHISVSFFLRHPVYLYFCQAYEVLSDPQKRSIYDEGGEQAIKEGGGRGGGGGFSSPMDIFNMMFGGGMGMGGGRQSNKSKPMVHKLGVTLEELYSGKTRKLAATRDIICSACSGKGGSNIKNCTGCKGRGVRSNRSSTYNKHDVTVQSSHAADGSRHDQSESGGVWRV